MSRFGEQNWPLATGPKGYTSLNRWVRLNDPNLTDKKFPGNPTNSFRAREGFKVVAEVKNWQGHLAEEIRAARDKVDLALKNGAPVIED